MPRTSVILDGLQDPAHAQAISRAWTNLGFDNAVDIAGQSGWLEKKMSSVQCPVSSVPDKTGVSPSPGAASSSTLDTGHWTLDNSGDIELAVQVARSYGIELRDRVGATFRPDNDLAALQAHMAYEYKSRLATALVFGLPALVLHYIAPALAGGGHDPRSMIFPWVLELLLVGWACLAGGWPILWQGGLAFSHLRATADLLTSLIVLGAYVPSAVGVLAMLFVSHPWFSLQPGHGPLVFVAMLAMILALLQRWLLYREIAHLSGRVMLMVPKLSRWLSLWMLLGIVLACVAGPRWGLTIALLMPPLIGLGAINPWSSGPSMVLPVFGFALFLLFGPALLHRQLGAEMVEIAAGFQAIMAAVMAYGWARLGPNNKPLARSGPGV